MSPQDGETYVDGTFGAGGYTRALLEAANCNVIAIDRDPAAQERARALQDEFGDRFKFIRGQFGDVADLLQGRTVDGFVLDIGVSSFQFDEADRGFSFRFGGPLDMRMDPTKGQTAADIVNTYEEEDLANLIYRYGEERKSRWVAKRIVSERIIAPIQDTQRLAEIVRAAVPRSKDGIDPATRTFQALRIAVNDELGELERALDGAPKILNDQGRLVVVSFHSLEDRIVKHKMREMAGKGGSGGSRYLPQDHSQGVESQKLFTIPKGKAIAPTKGEQSANPRARSAKLRLAIRTHQQTQQQTQKQDQQYGGAN